MSNKTPNAVNRYHLHQSQLETMGSHYQDMLAFGDGRGWRGDRNLVLKRHTLMDQFEVWYELPGEKSRLLFTIPTEDFDINLVCQKLAIAASRSNEDVIAEVDLHNEARKAQIAKDQADQTEHVTEKMHWAMRKDFHHEPAPITVPEHKLTNVDPA